MKPKAPRQALANIARCAELCTEAQDALDRPMPAADAVRGLLQLDETLERLSATVRPYRLPSRLVGCLAALERRQARLWARFAEQAGGVVAALEAGQRELLTMPMQPSQRLHRARAFDAALTEMLEALAGAKPLADACQRLRALQAQQAQVWSAVDRGFGASQRGAA